MSAQFLPCQKKGVVEVLQSWISAMSKKLLSFLSHLSGVCPLCRHAYVKAFCAVAFTCIAKSTSSRKKGHQRQGELPLRLLRSWQFHALMPCTCKSMCQSAPYVIQARGCQLLSWPTRCGCGRVRRSRDTMIPCSARTTSCRPWRPATSASGLRQASVPWFLAECKSLDVLEQAEGKRSTEI